MKQLSPHMKNSLKEEVVKQNEKQEKQENKKNEYSIKLYSFEKQFKK